MSVSPKSLSMDLNKHRVPGTNGSLIMSPQWDSLSIFLITHYLFFYNRNNKAYIILYVCDILLTTSSDSLREYIMSKLSSEFAMKNLDPLTYFLGNSVTQNSGEFFLS